MLAAIVIIGPTASGKTAIAHSIFENMKKQGLQSELVNLDAFQFYRGVDAGTAKPSTFERENYHYHLLDFLSPDTSIDAQTYAKMAHAACAEIARKGSVPICVGGSGLYLRAFLHGLDKLPDKNPRLRDFFKACAANLGTPELHRWLKEIDIYRASEINPNDFVRIERALEIFFLTGKKPSELMTCSKPLHEQKCVINPFVIHVDMNNDALLSRIKARVPMLWNEGWCEEIGNLRGCYKERIISLPAMRAIGYREVIDFVNGSGIYKNKEEVLDRIATLTWQYAKRQRTWNAKELCSYKIFDPEPFTIQKLSENCIEWWGKIYETSS